MRISLPFGCCALSLAVAGILAFTGSAHGQCAPALLASLDTPDTAFGVAVSGTVAYVADEQSGLQIIDVSDPANPTLLGSIGTPGLAFDVSVVGTVAYVAAAVSGLQVIDVSDPTNPSILGSIDTEFAQGIAVSGTIAYVADQFGGLRVIDVSDPENPSLIGSVDTEDRAMEVAVFGGVAYVADQLSGVQLIDVSDPANPAVLSAVASSDRALGIAASGTMAYAAVRDAGVQVIDASDPANPIVVGSLVTPQRALGIAVSGTLAYVSDGLGGLQVIDVSDPASPVIVGAVTTPGGDANRVAVLGTVAYVANFIGLRVIDVSRCIKFGACCVDGACLDLMAEATCATVGGAYLGPDTNCADGSCYNDDCEFAISVLEGETSFSTIGATTDGPALPPDCDEGPGTSFDNDIWYRYTPTASGMLTVSTCDQADFNTRVAAYTGPCDALEDLACRESGLGTCPGSTSLLKVPVIRDEAILVRLGAADGSAGTGTLTLTLEACASDIQPNGAVDFEDLLRLLSDWGPCP